MVHDPREDLRRIRVPVPAPTSEKDLQGDPADLDVIGAGVPGGAVTLRIPDLGHTLRAVPGHPSMGAYRKELREPVNREVLESVVRWCREVTGLG